MYIQDLGFCVQNSHSHVAMQVSATVFRLNVKKHAAILNQVKMIKL